jgi:predicted transcriptional regulator
MSIIDYEVEAGVRHIAPSAEQIMAAVQKGLDQLDRGEGIPHDEIKRQLASWLTN